MFDSILNIPRVLNMPAFWIYQGWEYARVLNILLVLNMTVFWIWRWWWWIVFVVWLTKERRLLSSSFVEWSCEIVMTTTIVIFHGSKYARVTKGLEYAWTYLNNSWICLTMPESAYICLNSLLIFTHCNLVVIFVIFFTYLKEP